MLARPLASNGESRTRLGMSIDGARGAFVRAFYEVVAPKVKQVAEDIEVLSVEMRART